MNTETYERTKRWLDLGLSMAALTGLALPMLGIAAAIKATSPGPVIHWSRRIGKGNREFKMPKFRTMRTDTPQVATHLMNDPERYVTRVGKILRRTSLDELPQLLSILMGDMSFVGPRPALYNQDDLVQLRTERGVHELTPGLTGWAQVNGRDELPIPVKVDFDAQYLDRRSLGLDLEIAVKTALQAVRGKGVDH
jgi:O-antigen biosynthesis protein WbqP